jgi:hypothetical protein
MHVPFPFGGTRGADGSHDDHEDTKITTRIQLKGFVVIVIFVSIVLMSWERDT